MNACSSDYGRRIDDSNISIEIIPTPAQHITVSEINAYQKNERLIVSGKVKRLHSSHRQGHVHLVICDPAGTLLAQRTVRIRDLVSKKRGEARFPFSTHFDHFPPAGSKIRAKFHAGMENDASVLKCDS
jgi:hypothetical protein